MEITSGAMTVLGNPNHDSLGRFAPSNQTHTPEFKAWFGGSKVVDAEGHPLRVYHGTAYDFGTFQTTSEMGAHFGTVEQTEDIQNNDITLPVYLSIQNPVRLIDQGHFDGPSIAEQLIVKGVFSEQEVSADTWMPTNVRVQKLLLDKGYDGIVYQNRREGYGRSADTWADSILGSYSDAQWKAMHPAAHDSWIAFKPTQIKSAIGNTGKFDPRNPLITAEFTEAEHPRDAKGRWAPASFDNPLRVTLWHGTSSELLAHIKTEGLRPAAHSGANDWAFDHWGVVESNIFPAAIVASRHASVFLTKNPYVATKYAEIAETQSGGKAIVLAVDVPKSNITELISDEASGEYDRSYRFKGKIDPKWIVGQIPLASLKPRHDSHLLPSTDTGFTPKLKPLATHEETERIYIVLLADRDHIAFPLEPRRAARLLAAALRNLANPNHDAKGRFAPKSAVHPAITRAVLAYHGLRTLKRGNFGHAGRPGHVGGSATAGFRAPSTPEDHARIRALKVPPAWAHVRINPDEDAPLQAVGIDVKGRTQYRYSAEHSEASAAEKFARLKAFHTALPKLRKQIAADIGTGDEAAEVLYLIDKTGFRIGSSTDTHADQQAYGASTLEARHVKIHGDTVSFNFIGKKGVRVKKSVTDAALAKMLTPRIAAGGRARVFASDGSDVRAYLHQHAEGFTPKDFRTWHGTTIALSLVAHMSSPKTMKALKEARRMVATAVSEFLGNTPAVALKSYIDPTVFGRWAI